MDFAIRRFFPRVESREEIVPYWVYLIVEQMFDRNLSILIGNRDIQKNGFHF